MTMLYLVDPTISPGLAKTFFCNLFHVPSQLTLIWRPRGGVLGGHGKYLLDVQLSVHISLLQY